MIDLKPFYQSYTRAAHLRWLKGDLDGAVRMMSSAVRAASPRDPNRWHGPGSPRRLRAAARPSRRSGADGSGVSTDGPRLRGGAARQGRIELAQKKYPEAIEPARACGPPESAARIRVDAGRRASRRRTARRSRRAPKASWAATGLQTIRAPRALSIDANQRRLSASGRQPAGGRAREARTHRPRRRVHARALAWALVDIGEVDEALR